MDRIKSECKYGIFGQGETSLTSKLMKQNYSYKEFIEEMKDFEDEDKSDLS